MNPLRLRPTAILIAALSLSGWQEADASVLITIDVTSPDSVVFSATDAFPLVNSNSTTFGQGITLVDLFGGVRGLAFFTPILGNQISPSLSSYSYDRYSSVFSRNLTFLNNGSVEGGASAPQNFATNAIALTGSSTLNLESFILTEGRTGDIVLGTSVEGIVIGQWQTFSAAQAIPIPEPSGAFLFLSGSLGLLLRRKRPARG